MPNLVAILLVLSVHTLRHLGLFAEAMSAATLQLCYAFLMAVGSLNKWNRNYFIQS